MPFTAYPDVDAALELLLARLQALLGPRLAGLYVFGSLAAGDFDPAVSDIDLIAATVGDMEERDLAALQAMHADLAQQLPRWNDRIEVGYIALDALRRYRPEDRQALISPGEPFHVTTVGAQWVMHRHVVRERGLALYGPPSQTLVDPVSRDDLLDSLQHIAADWHDYVNTLDTRNGQAYAVLTMCRALRTATHGDLLSKKAAAHWAAQSFPEWSSLIRQALTWWQTVALWRAGQVPNPETLPDMRRFVTFTLDYIGRQAGQRRPQQQDDTTQATLSADSKHR